MEPLPELLHHVLNVILPVLLCIGVGVLLARIDAPFDRKSLSKLVQTVGYPALIVSHISEGHVAVQAFAVMAAAAASAVLAFVLIGGAFLLLVRLPLRAFIAPMSLNNTGNIGLPVAMLAYGDAGLSYAFAFMVVVLLGIFTYGSWVPRGEVSLRTVLTSPVLYAIAIALTMLGLGLHLPQPLAPAFDILGGLVVPLLLLLLGHTLAGLDRRGLGIGTLLALCHLAIGAGVGFGLAWAFGFTGTERGVFILMAMMPVSVATYLFVEQYQPEQAPKAAGFIMASTVLTFVALPVVMAFGI
ncbi:AEC family transporter [Thiohalocapsa sp. ML1]|uniref:AEC family transporter n=1 Tax=Thiohalocapsa sp. ML1 TaxID=1431688 RepID=UPI00073236D7|nr:AEC family transporter [Thiohalocapsa sp. ML1]